MHGVAEYLLLAMAVAALTNLAAQLVASRWKLALTIGMPLAIALFTLATMPIEAWPVAAFVFVFALAASGAGLVGALLLKAGAKKLSGTEK
jgi:hypothetical protein